LLSGLAYWNTRRLLMNEAMEKSEVMLREVEAIRSYVADQLRPEMYNLYGRDTFIIEAMSTTYVSVTIMEKFAKTMPGYVYRRASVNPHNPRNLADPYEEEMMDWFDEDHGRLFWQGIVKKNGEEYFMSMVPDYFAPSCIRCHGKVEDAPVSLVKRYGRVGGFRFKAGDLAGIDSIAIPVSTSLRKAMQGSAVLFGMMIAATLVWLWLLNTLFQRLVVQRLGTMLSQIGESKSGKKEGTGDELDALQDSVGSLWQYVQSARKGVDLQPNFLGDYVVESPISSGAMSWLYHGYSAATGEKVSLKIGFQKALKNPLYLACYETEIHLLTTFSHPNLPKVQERIDSVLVLEQLSGKTLLSYFKNQPLPEKSILKIFSQLCDVCATLHAQGIVHHDLRPEVFLLNNESKLYLTDMGLATSDLRPDPVAAAGLGPQGNPIYMAPEQLAGKRGDSRSDIYALGVLLFLAHTGSIPFVEEKRSLHKWQQVKKQFSSSENDLSAISALPGSVKEVIVKAMAFDVNERYQWVEDFWEDLKEAGE